jgi:hypothetical protein
MSRFPTIQWIAAPPYNQLRLAYGLGFHEALSLLDPQTENPVAEELRRRIRSWVNGHIFGLSHFLTHALREEAVAAVRWLRCPALDMARWVRIEAQKKHSRVLRQQKLVIGAFLLQEGFVRKEDLIEAMFLPVRRQAQEAAMWVNRSAQAAEEVRYCNFTAGVTLATLRHLQELGVTWDEGHLRRMLACMEQNQRGRKKAAAALPSLEQLRASLGL